MIPYAVYKVVHLVGVMMVYLSLGSMVTAATAGGVKNSPTRKFAMITHGVGLLLSLVAGFGLLARLGIVHGGLPGWAIAKLCIWAIFGVVVGILIRKPSIAKPLWIFTLLLGLTAAYLAGSKPF